MDSYLRTIYLRECITQCEFALNAIRGLENVLPRIGQASEDGDFERSRILQQEIFRSLHSFLTHASNLSKMFWPAPPRRRKQESDAKYQERISQVPKVSRATDLRAKLGLPVDHILSNRTLRDHLEHFDERLDHWSATSTRRNYVQDTIGPKNAIAGIDDTDMMRWFDPSTATVRFRGEEYELRPLVSAVQALRDDCTRALEREERAARDEVVQATRRDGERE